MLPKKDLPPMFATFPGRRPPVVPPKPAPPVRDDWKAHPTHYPVNGVMREFYTIQHLSLALDKSPVTIRAWETKGLLPSSSLRSPRPKRAPLGTKPRGRRLWTKAHIEGILRIAREEECILNGMPPTKRFAERVDKLFTQLHAQFMKESSSA